MDIKLEVCAWIIFDSKYVIQAQFFVGKPLKGGENMLNSFTNIDVNVVSNMTADSNSVVICFIVAVVVISLAVLRNNRNQG